MVTFQAEMKRRSSGRDVPELRLLLLEKPFSSPLRELVDLQGARERQSRSGRLAGPGESNDGRTSARCQRHPALPSLLFPSNAGVADAEYERTDLLCRLLKAAHRVSVESSLACRRCSFGSRELLPFASEETSICRRNIKSPTKSTSLLPSLSCTPCTPSSLTRPRKSDYSTVRQLASGG